MKKLALLLTLCFALAVPAIVTAQQPPTPPDVPDKADVLKFLDLIHARTQMVHVLDGLAKQMRLGAEQGFKQKVPDATPEQLAKVDQLFDGIFKELPLDEIVDAVIPIYQKHLTKTDLAAITSFYSSPAGQKVLKEMPAVTSEAMEAGGEIGRRAFAAKSLQLDHEIAELVNQTKEN